MRESAIEKILCARVKSLGGLCEKFASPGRRNVPDRILSFPNGKVVFVELKATGEVPTPAQLRDHARRRAMGFDVRVIASSEAAHAFTI